jgi:hypothetical protein
MRVHRGARVCAELRIRRAPFRAGRNLGVFALEGVGADGVDKERPRAYS